MDDKRQYSGNIVHNAMGNILFSYFVYGGKTEKSLPPVDLRLKFPNMVFGVSPNHWFNLEHKERLVKEFVSKTNVALQSALNSRGSTQALVTKMVEAQHMILILDCWSVNLSEEFRLWVAKEHPKLHICYIPANCTGLYQINDT